MAQAQVYSVNVVGYVNQVLPAGVQVAVANPLDNGTNDLNSVFGALAKGSSINTWNVGAGSFVGALKTATAWTPNSPAPVGVGLFVNSKSAITNTYVGEVIVGPGESTTNSLPAGLQVLAGSAIPYAGTLNSTNIGLLTLAKGSAINTWNVGSQTYVGALKTATTWTPDTALGVAEGFFVNSKTATNWVQKLPAN
jgi:hypothetical protein